jgi:ElaB/YqjD/DUF883 family membrane-anchored ribosome-binding protein
MNNRIQDILTSAGPGLEQLEEQAEIIAAAARERLAEGRETVRAFIVDKPARALGIALGVGVLLGWLVKRR